MRVSLAPRRGASAVTRPLLHGASMTQPLAGARAAAPDAPAPLPPDEAEKLLYRRRRAGLLLGASVVSFACAMWSTFGFLASAPVMRALLLPYVALTAAYYGVSFLANATPRGFDLRAHRALTRRHAAAAALAGVDVLLPTAGEDVAVLANTWNGVRALVGGHAGVVTVFVLDDSDRPAVRELAERFGFVYAVRENRGWFKKSGNLRFGYELSRPLGHEFAVIFDADFRPRSDFLRELLPYFYEEPRLGLVQSPQYFDARREQDWLQRGAGAVQEFFYRFSQVARQSHDAAICVGTNAIYRRAALDLTGGTALIEHSEDVHTGFNMRLAGYGLRYVPLILARGVCPDGLSAFFKQQYRWCMGSMSLLGSRKFWGAPLRLRQRVCYLSGFGYYIHTALSLLAAPLIPLFLLTAAPEAVSARNYLPLLPATLYAFVLFPLWHRADYGAEVWAVKHAYSWAHLFALVDVLRRRPMGWSPTGSRGGPGGRYVAFRAAQLLLSFVPCLAWAALAAWRVVALHQLVFTPLLLTGAFAAYTTGRVAVYRERARASARYHRALDTPTEVGTVVRAVTLPPSPGAGAGAAAQSSEEEVENAS